METKETKKIPNVVLNTIVKTFKANERFYNDLAKAEARLAKAQMEVEQNKAFIESAEFAVMEITKKYSPNGKAYKSCDLYEWIQVPAKDENGNIKYKEDGSAVTRKTAVLKNENVWPVEVDEIIEQFGHVEPAFEEEV